eukprot:s2443_g2.t1
MALQLELGPLHTRPAADREEPQSPGQVLVPDAAGRGSRLTAARLDPRFQPCLTPQHWRMNQEGVDSDGREARANLMKMYVAGGFDDRQPRSGRERALRLVVSWPWVLLQLFAIVVDSAALIEPVLKNGLDELWLTAEPTVFHALKMVFLSVVYLADVALRLYGFGPKVFFAKWWNLFDTAIVILTAANAISAVTESAGGVGPFRFLRLLRVFRVLRIVRIALFISHTVPRCWNRMRRITGENKRRFVSLEQDFDLDLVYITPRLISMSVPAGGCLMRFYRNPLGEVVRFFETFHAGNYLIVNACPEIPYKEAAFRTGRVERFNVKDWMLPTILSTASALCRWKAAVLEIWTIQMVECTDLEKIEVCSHRGNLAKDDRKTKVLTTAGLSKVFDQGFRCADLDLSSDGKAQRVGHPADLALFHNGSLHEAMTFPELLMEMKQRRPRLIGLELKTSSEGLPAELTKLLEDLRKAELPWQSTAVWYLPQDISLFSQLHREQYPEILGIMAMFDRPWHGAPAASNESLDLAAGAGIQVLGSSVHVSSRLLREGQQRGFQVLAFGVNSKEDLIKAVQSGVHFAVSDDPVAVREVLQELRSTFGCSTGFNFRANFGEVVIAVLAIAACLLRISWLQRLQMLILLACGSVLCYHGW